jgi:hypothetical protein
MLKTENNTSICCLLYPQRCGDLFEGLVLPYLQETFDLECYGICYEPIDRECIQKVKNTLNKSCIVLFAYIDDMSSEYLYKLGLAHAYDSHVILVHFRDEEIWDIPEYINFHEIVSTIKGTSDDEIFSFVEKIDEHVASFLSKDLINSLYEKAARLCNKLEKKTARVIDVVDVETFSNRLSEGDISTCINDYSKASAILLRKIVASRHTLFAALNTQNLQEKPAKKPSDAVSPATFNLHSAG